MAALPGFRPETSSTVTLGSTVGLRELLAVGWSLSPAPGLAGLMAGGALSLRLLEVVDVDISALRGPGDDLIPLDGLDVAEVVVVENAHTPLENVWKYARVTPGTGSTEGQQEENRESSHLELGLLTTDLQLTGSSGQKIAFENFLILFFIVLETGGGNVIKCLESQHKNKFTDFSIKNLTWR